MKNLPTIFFLVMLPFLISAQAIRPFKAFDIGTGASMNIVSGDAETSTRTPAVNFNLGYNLNPYCNIIAELQFGQLAGGDSLSLSGRQFQNQFKSVLLRAQVHLGQFILNSESWVSNASRHIYIGSGIGLIENNISQINRSSRFIPDYYTGGTNQSINAYIPARIGYELKVQNMYQETLFKIDLGYQYNFVLGDEIDGFKTGSLKDTFSQLFLGLKFCAFGRQWRHSY